MKIQDMKLTRQGSAPQRRQTGVSLIEVLVAVLILSLGLLGMAGMQARAVKTSQSSYARGQAVMLSYYMMDAMRADPDTAKKGDYNTTKSCAASDFTASTLVDHTRSDWIDSLKASLGDLESTCGGITCDTEGLCEVRVYWDDSLAGGLGEQTFNTSSRL